MSTKYYAFISKEPDGFHFWYPDFGSSYSTSAISGLVQSKEDIIDTVETSLKTFLQRMRSANIIGPRPSTLLELSKLSLEVLENVYWVLEIDADT